jgi:membrane-associated phospholipid phosphatase
VAFATAYHRPTILAATSLSSRFPHALPAAGIAATLLVAVGALSHFAGDASPSYRALREAMGSLPDWFWSDLTFFGFGLTAAILVGLVRDRSMRFFAVSIWSFALGTLAIQVVKRTLVTPRPLTLLPDLPPIGAHLFWGSMPSGHAATALGLAATFILVTSRSWRSVVVLIAVASVVSLSRVAVGAHWVGDILVGAGIGVAAAAGGVVIERRVDLARRLATPYGQLAIATVQIVTGVLMVWRPLGYPLAQPLQWLVGVVGVGAGLYRLWQMRPSAARIGGVAP